MAVIGNLVANLSVNNRGWVSGISGALPSLGRLASGASTAASSISSIAAGVFVGNAALSGMSSIASSAISSISGLATESVRLAASLETQRMGFVTLLGSADAADKKLSELRDFAKGTPFEFAELTDQTRKLMALGFSADDVIPVLTRTGNAVSALGLDAGGLDRVNRALGQIAAKGKLSAQEVNQLAENGIPAWQAVADQIGVSVPQAMKMAEEGAISSGTALNAIFAMMDEKFSGAMENAAQTTTGRFNAMKESVSFILTDIGAEIIRAFDFQGMLVGAQAFVDAFGTNVMPSIVSGLNTVGTFTTTLLTDLATAWTNWGQYVASGLTTVFGEGFNQIGMMLTQILGSMGIKGFSDLVRNFDLHLAKMVLMAERSGRQIAGLLLDPFGDGFALGDIDREMRQIDNVIKARNQGLLKTKPDKPVVAPELKLELPNFSDAFAKQAAEEAGKKLSVSDSSMISAKVSGPVSENVRPPGLATAALSSSREAASLLLRGVTGSGNPMVKAQKALLQEQKKTNSILTDWQPDPLIAGVV